MAESQVRRANAFAQIAAAAGALPTTHRPTGNHKTVPAEQPTETVAVVETAGATPVLAAEATALPAPTIAPAGAAAVAAPVLHPAQLPNIGGQATPIPRARDRRTAAYYRMAVRRRSR